MKSARLLLAGDLHMPFGAARPPSFSPRLLELVRECGFVCGDFEAPLTEIARPAPKAGPAIRQDPRLVPALVEAGFTAMNLANNHVSDFGAEALAATRRTLEQSGFDVLGCGNNAAEACSPLRIELEGRKIALFACAEAEFGILRLDSTIRAGVAWMLDPSLRSRIAEEARTCDLVVVQCHAGVEEEILPLPELRSLYRSWIEAGADFVVGHHPHIVQGSEKHLDGEIHYSLGNAYFDHPDMPKSGGFWNRGLLLEIGLDGDAWTSRIHAIRRTDHLVDLDDTPEAALELEKATLALGPDYAPAVDALALELWETRYRGYYEQCFAPPPGSRRFLGRLKALLSPSLAPSGSLGNRNMLLHNIRIESHRWLVERALTLLHERDLEEHTP